MGEFNKVLEREVVSFQEYSIGVQCDDLLKGVASSGGPNQIASPRSGSYTPETMQNIKEFQEKQRLQPGTADRILRYWSESRAALIVRAGITWNPYACSASRLFSEGPAGQLPPALLGNDDSSKE